MSSISPTLSHILVLTLYQGVDMKDIQIVIQWRLTCDLKTLWQRIGRAVRDLSLTGMAIVFVEAKYFDETRARREAARKKPATRVAGMKRPAPAPSSSSREDIPTPPPSKRPRRAAANAPKRYKHNDEVAL